MAYKEHLKYLKIRKNFKTGYKRLLFNQNSFDFSII